MRRSIRAVLGVAAAVVVGARRVRQRAPTAPAAEPFPTGDVTITLSGWSLATTPEFKTLADGFHALHPNVTVRAQGVRRRPSTTPCSPPTCGRQRARHRHPEELQDVLHLRRRRRAARRLRRGGKLSGQRPAARRRTRSTARPTACPTARTPGCCTTTRTCSTRPRSPTRTARGPGTTTPRRPRTSPPGSRRPARTPSAPTSTRGSRPCRASRSPRPRAPT